MGQVEHSNTLIYTQAGWAIPKVSAVGLDVLGSQLSLTLSQKDKEGAVQQMHPQAAAPGRWPACYHSIVVSLFLVGQRPDPWRDWG